MVGNVVDATVLRKYKAFAATAFVTENPDYAFCPGAGCDRVIKAPRRILDVSCACGAHFCFQCAKEAHEPAHCGDLAKWDKKNEGDGMTAQWLSESTKDCPKCHTAIEKNGGCNHMTCRKCKHEFCWLCFGNWRGHSACNRLAAAGPSKNAAEAARHSLKAYLHYWHRYNTHLHSGKAEGGLRKMAAAKADAVGSRQDSSFSFFDMGAFVDSAESLIRCRQVRGDVGRRGETWRDVETRGSDVIK